VAREFGRFEAVSRRRSISRGAFHAADGEAGLDSKGAVVRTRGALR